MPRCYVGGSNGYVAPHRVFRATVPSPQPLSRWERGSASPSPLGRRCPEGADEGTGRSLDLFATARRCGGRTLTPTPLPVGEGLALLLLPSGEGAPKGRMRVRAKPRPVCDRQALRRPYPHPNPSPGGRGASASPSPLGRRCPEGADEGTGEASTCLRSPGVAGGRTLTPTPLPVGEGLALLLLPSGEGAPQGRMRVRAKPRNVCYRQAFRGGRTLTPTLSPRERSYCLYSQLSGRRPGCRRAGTPRCG
ncbi:hypothetical protein GGR64_002049 [Xanthomonas arboricola]|nr:hypothetical protein [Xanthomonas sp. 3307]